MIYPVEDQSGHRIGTIMKEEFSTADKRWVAYTNHDAREAFSTWEAARIWIETSSTKNGKI